MTLHCDNITVINISKNLVQHSRIKHMDICNHFIRSQVEDKVIELKHISIKHQLAGNFAKGLAVQILDSPIIFGGVRPVIWLSVRAKGVE